MFRMWQQMLDGWDEWDELRRSQMIHTHIVCKPLLCQGQYTDSYINTRGYQIFRCPICFSELRVPRQIGFAQASSAEAFLPKQHALPIPPYCRDINAILTLFKQITARPIGNALRVQLLLQMGFHPEDGPDTPDLAKTVLNMTTMAYQPVEMAHMLWKAYVALWEKDLEPYPEYVRPLIFRLSHYLERNTSVPLFRRAGNASLEALTEHDLPYVFYNDKQYTYAYHQVVVCEDTSLFSPLAFSLQESKDTAAFLYQSYQESLQRIERANFLSSYEAHLREYFREVHGPYPVRGKRNTMYETFYFAY